METNLAYEYGDGWREELIDGQITALASPSVGHSTVVENIHSIFRTYLKGRRCRAFSDHVDVHLTERDIYIPDVTVVCDPKKITNDGIFGAPDLVVEVLSPSTGKNDKGVKKDVYEQCGVREYWIVDPVSLTIDQYLLENGRFTLREMYTLYRSYMTEHMTEEDKEKLVKAFPCGIFPDMPVSLEDVFEGVTEFTALSFEI